MFVIMSKGERGFWSNRLGWVPSAEFASRFPDAHGTLPASHNGDASWMPWAKAHGHSFQCTNIECGDDLVEPAMVCPHCAMPVSHGAREPQSA
jgi:hypothetical protein